MQTDLFPIEAEIGKQPDQLTLEMCIALEMYQERKGETWRQDLLDDWRTGRDVNALPEPYGPWLRRMRNTIGPTGLMEITGKKGSWKR